MEMHSFFRKPSIVNVWAARLTETLEFPTASGTQVGNPGDYVIDYGGAPGTDTAPYPCPAAQFERTYVAGVGLSFGLAVLALKAGMKIQRAGWNGKGMYVYIMGAAHPTAIDGNKEMQTWEAYMVLHTASGTEQPGWNASTPDVLADDWQIVE